MESSSGQGAHAAGPACWRSATATLGPTRRAGPGDGGEPAGMRPRASARSPTATVGAASVRPPGRVRPAGRTRRFRHDLPPNPPVPRGPRSRAASGTGARGARRAGRRHLAACSTTIRPLAPPAGSTSEALAPRPVHGPASCRRSPRSTGSCERNTPTTIQATEMEGRPPCSPTRPAPGPPPGPGLLPAHEARSPVFGGSGLVNEPAAGRPRGVRCRSRDRRAGRWARSTRQPTRAGSSSAPGRAKGVSRAEGWAPVVTAGHRSRVCAAPRRVLGAPVWPSWSFVPPATGTGQRKSGPLPGPWQSFRRGRGPVGVGRKRRAAGCGRPSRPGRRGEARTGYAVRPGRG